HRDYVLSQRIALLRRNGEAVAFATVMTTELTEEVTVGLMRHKPGAASRYAMEYLFIRLIECFRDQGYRSLCLGMVPLSGLRAHGGGLRGPPSRAGGRGRTRMPPPISATISIRARLAYRSSF